MKLEKHRYDDVVILKFVGEFDSFNLPGFSERIDAMRAAGDRRFILDLHLMKFINSPALGYLVQLRRQLDTDGGALVLARPSRFVRRTLTTLGLDEIFQIFDSPEAAIVFLKQGVKVGEVRLEPEEIDEALSGATPILFRPAGEGDSDRAPNQVGRIVTLYPDGLLFRYDCGERPEEDPVASFLKAGQTLKAKFRQPLAAKEHYFEVLGQIVEVSKTLSQADRLAALTVRLRYDRISDEDKTLLDEFVASQNLWRQEVGRGS